MKVPWYRVAVSAKRKDAQSGNSPGRALHGAHCSSAPGAEQQHCSFRPGARETVATGAMRAGHTACTGKDTDAGEEGVEEGVQGLHVVALLWKAII